MIPQVRAYLYIDDFDCSPDVITSVLGIQPTRVWLVGDRISQSRRVRTSNGWTLESPLINEPDPEVHLKWLMENLPQTLEVLRAETSKWDAQLSLVIEMVDETPPFHLSISIINRMSQLGLELDIDMYVIEE